MCARSVRHSLAFGQSVRAQTTSQYRLIPHASWDCGMPEGIAGPEAGELVLEIEIPLERAIDVGRTQYGMRRVAVGLEGSVKGPKFSGAVAPAPSISSLRSPTAASKSSKRSCCRRRTEATSTYVLRARGRTPMTSGWSWISRRRSASEHAWLNSGKFVARRELNAAGKAMRLVVYDVSKVAVGAANAISIVKPADAVPQPWGYRTKQARSNRARY